jgi:PAS domain S-box-containing protein
MILNKILIADDDATTRAILSTALQSAGFEVGEAVDGPDTLAKFRERPYDLVMLDVDMPGLTGYEVCAALRADVGDLLPIVVVTGMDDVQSIDAAYRAGATDFIAKPVNWTLVGHRARYLLRSYQATLDLRAAEASNSAILRAMPDLLFEVDLDGRYVDYHSPRTDLLMEPDGSFIGKTVHETLPPEAAAVCQSAILTAHDHGWSAGAVIELPLPRGRSWFELSVARKASGSDGKPHFIVISRDITERKRAEEALRASEARLRMILETEPECVKIVSSDGELLEMNAAGLAMLEADSVDAVNRQGLLNFVCPEHRAAFSALHRSVIEGNGGALEFEIVASKGSRRWLQTTVVPLRDCATTAMTLLGITRDITEHKRLQFALLDASRREQRALAHELHDGLGQELTGLALFAKSLASAARRGELPTAESLDGLAGIASNTIRTCRAISRGLSPLNEVHGDLIPALRNMVTLQRESYGADIRFETIDSAPISLPAPAVDHLYRIAQEAVTNARKHANARSIRILLASLPTTIRLEILDDGIGLPPEASEFNGLGLGIMRYRAAMIGGRLSVGSGDSGGTRIVVSCQQTGRHELDAGSR